MIQRAKLLILASLMLVALCALALSAQARDDIIIEEMTIEEGAIDASNTVTGGTATGGSATGGSATGGEGGEGGDATGGDLTFNYPKQPVSSPAMALGGVCSSSASLTTQDVGLSVGNSDPLCRQIELIKLAVFLGLKTQAVEHYNTAVEMEKRTNWFSGSRIGSFLRGAPIVGVVFRLL